MRTSENPSSTLFVNKGKKKGPRLLLAPAPFFVRANYFASYGATRLAVARTSNADVTHSEGLTCTSVNLLPSGATNRSYRKGSPSG